MNSVSSISVYRPAQHVANLASNSKFEQLWTAPWSEIEEIELVPGHPLSKDVLVVPVEWVRAPRHKKQYHRTIDFTKALPPFVDRNSTEGESVLRRLKRIAAITMSTTVRFPNRKVKQPTSPNIWVQQCKSTINATNWILTNTTVIQAASACPDEGQIFQRLNKAAVEDLRRRGGHSNFFRQAVARLAALADMKVIDDWPNFDIGTGKEPRRKHASVPTTSSRPKGRWLPFSDEFTSKLGKAALWLTESLSPVALECLTSVLQDIPLVSAANLSDYLQAKAFRKAIALWSSTSTLGYLSLPYALRVGAGGSEMSAMTNFPPQNWAALRHVAGVIQTAHLIIIALATAARESEVLGLTRDCLRRVETQDLLVGYTFKLSEEADGEKRDWPLPKIAVTAIQQQQRLADILAPGAQHLWLSFRSNKFDELLALQKRLREFCDQVIVDGKMLRDWCPDGRVHLHRFRKTVARLAGLSLVGSTSIMFDILGHRDPEMTLNYILSDPDLQDEIRKIAAEASIMMSKTAIEQSADNGGYAAPLVKDLKQRLAARSGEDELGVDTLAEAAEILSMNGQVSMIRPGVLCTKTLRQWGVCTKRVGIPDIGNCSTGCHHRLELAAAAEDCTKAIERILLEMPTADNVMMRPWWQAQLVAQLNRFPSIRQRLLADERILAALQGVEPRTIEGLFAPTNGEAAPT